MGWASGSTLMSRVIAAMQKANIHESQREIAYKGIIEAFEGEDCDTLDECVGEDPAFDLAFENRDAEDDECTQCDQPSNEGLKRYPPNGRYDANDSPGPPCTCTTDCPSDCKGQCGCVACTDSYGDFLSSQ